MLKERNVLTSALAFACTLAVAGCSASNDTASQSSTTTTTTTATTSAASRPECAAVADAARTLATDVGKFLSGNASAEQVKTDFDGLSGAIADAKEVVGSDIKAELDEAADALGKAQDTFAEQPLDLAALRTDMSDALSALSDAVRVCAPDATSVPGSITESTTVTS